MLFWLSACIWNHCLVQYAAVSGHKGLMQDAIWEPDWSLPDDDCEALGGQTSRRTIPRARMPTRRKLLAHWNSRPQEAITQLVERKGTKMGLEEASWVFLESGQLQPYTGWPHGVTPVTHIIALILSFTYWKDLPWYILVPHLLPSQLCPFLVWALTRSSNTSILLFLRFPIYKLPTCHAELLLLLPK